MATESRRAAAAAGFLQDRIRVGKRKTRRRGGGGGRTRRRKRRRRRR